uniref:Uncharacterized protein n=1 Tax=Bursaphelenchus xylophilus TaxID=6326 RepID=A0A1I7SX56_BURXY
MSNMKLLLFCLLASVIFGDLIEWDHPTGGTLPPGHPPIPGGDTGSDSSGKKSTMPDYMKYFYVMFCKM